jgi:site-specific DNA-methyltransferase (adenine-specific)
MNDKTCDYTEWRTPERILEPVREYMGGQIRLDPATSEDNPTCAQDWYTPLDDGLVQEWYAPAFVNPPYGKVIRDWVAKIAEEAARGVEIIALLPGQRFEQQYWQDHVFCEQLTAMCMVRKRLAFIKPDGIPAKGNPYGSFLYLYNGSWSPFSRTFEKVGTCVRITERARYVE